MKALRVTAASSRGGEALLARAARRLDDVLDRRVEREARTIVRAIRSGGEAALLEQVRRLDAESARTVAALRLTPSAADAVGADVDADVRAAIDFAVANARRLHRAERGEQERSRTLEVAGARVEACVRPLRRVGLYVPGGRASYPSTAIYTVVPAQEAGVASIAVATPAATFRRSPALRYTLAALGVTEIWGIGGAPAIAAFAFGCGPIARVDLVAGPGNAWVTAAKREVAGAVAIDGLMGPSEVAVVATDDADARRVAADLLAQAEHDPKASAILVTTSRAFARAVAAAVEEELTRLGGSESAVTARASLRRFGGALVVASLDEAVAVVDALAPEHLELAGREVEAAAERFELAGAVFVGSGAAEVFGDYLAGPSHVLPTCGAARFASGLSTATFERRFHRIALDGATAAAWSAPAAAFARAEGLPAHARAAELRGEPS